MYISRVYTVEPRLLQRYLICGFLVSISNEMHRYQSTHFFVSRIGRPILSPTIINTIASIISLTRPTCRHFYFLFFCLAPYYIFVPHFFLSITFLTHTYNFWSYFILSSSSIFFSHPYPITHVNHFFIPILFLTPNPISIPFFSHAKFKHLYTPPCFCHPFSQPETILFFILFILQYSILSDHQIQFIYLFSYLRYLTTSYPFRCITKHS